jgi:hypothetical protein
MELLADRGVPEVWRRSVAEALAVIDLLDERIAPLERELGPLARADRRVCLLDRLEPIGLHECRHTFASLMIAAAVNAKALSTFLGHASVTITLDRYGHLFPGSGKEAAGLLDSYLERSVGGGPAWVRCTCAALRCTKRPCSGVERGRLGVVDFARHDAQTPCKSATKRRGGIRTLGGR